MTDKTWREPWVASLDWPCPSCGSGRLRLVSGTLHALPGRAEREAQAEHPDPQRLTRFNALLQCSTPYCREVAAITGDKLEQQHTQYEPQIEEEVEYTTTDYRIASFTPSPMPFIVPRATPGAIKEVIGQAARLFWVDPAAAATRCRETLEKILTHFKVPEGDPDKRRPDLHVRIEAFGRMDDGKWAEAANTMMAMKHIGNAGTHSDPIERGHVVDAFEMLESVLEELFVGGRRALRAKVEATNAQKGPVRSR